MVIARTAFIEVITVDSNDSIVKLLLSFGEDCVLEYGRASLGTIVSRTDLVERALTNSSHGIVEEVVGETEAVRGWRVEEGDDDAQELVGDGLEVKVLVCQHD